MRQFDVTVVKIGEEWSVLAWLEGVGFRQRKVNSESHATQVALKLTQILSKKWQPIN